MQRARSVLSCEMRSGVDWLPARAMLEYPAENNAVEPAKEVDDMAKRKTAKVSKTELLVDSMKAMPEKALSS